MVFGKKKKVRVIMFDKTWRLMDVEKTKHGHFVNYLDEVGKLLEDGTIDSNFWLKEWRHYN